MKWAYNLHEALRRLGVKDARKPELVDSSVLQAMVVGDVSHLANPLLPPTAWAGAFQGVVAGETGGIQVHARAEGGCFIAQAFLGITGANVRTVFTIDAANPLAADVFANTCTWFNMGPTNVRSVAYYGTSTVGVPANAPHIWCPSTNSVSVLEGIYLPNNYWFTWRSGTVQIAVDTAVLIWEPPVGPTPDS